MPSEVIAVECYGFVRAQILCPDQVWVGKLEAAGAVVSRFEGAFLLVARGARLPTSTSSDCFGLCSFLLLSWF